MSEAFHDTPMDEESCEGQGIILVKKMPFDLTTGAPSKFGRLIDISKKRFAGLILERNLPNMWCDQVFTYLDDWIIVIQDINKHLAMFSLVFEVFREAKLISNREKLILLVKMLNFLVILSMILI